MPDFNRYMKLNPAILVRRLVAVEGAIERQLALNDAAAGRLVEWMNEAAQKGAFVVALLEKLGGRFELTPAELGRLQESNLRVHYKYPGPESPNFVMVLSAEGDAAEEQKIAALEAKLRAQGISDDEIAMLHRRLDDAAAEARATFPDDAPAATQEHVGLDPARPGDDRMVSPIVGPDGQPPKPGDS